MIVDKVFVAKQVATKLRSTEAALDAALVEATELMGDMIRGRIETKVSAVATDATMSKVAAAIAAPRASAVANWRVCEALAFAPLRSRRNANDFSECERFASSLVR